jgi:plasmid replication initiation protein
MKELIVKDNALINASYNLDLVEQRMILLAIIEARESGKGINADEPLTIKAANYEAHFGVQKDASYKALQAACENLFNRQFSYVEERPNGVAVIRSRWVSQIAYIESAASVELIFASSVVPLITRLEKHFTSYELEQVKDLNSAYAVRLYEILIAWRSSGKTPVISLTEFRQKLGVLPDEYPRMFDLKKRVLDLAVDQISQNTDIQVTYEQHKTGRNVTGFSFTFKAKKAVQKTLSKNLWEAVPVGTRYQNAVGDIWIKEENGFLFCEEKKQSMPPPQAQKATQDGTLKLHN